MFGVNPRMLYRAWGCKSFVTTKKIRENNECRGFEQKYFHISQIKNWRKKYHLPVVQESDDSSLYSTTKYKISHW